MARATTSWSSLESLKRISSIRCNEWEFLSSEFRDVVSHYFTIKMFLVVVATSLFRWLPRRRRSRVRASETYWNCIFFVESRFQKDDSFRSFIATVMSHESKKKMYERLCVLRFNRVAAAAASHHNSFEERGVVHFATTDGGKVFQSWRVLWSYFYKKKWP